MAAPQDRFAIALICARDANGDLLGRPIPLWQLLEEAYSLKTTDQMERAFDRAEPIAAHIGLALRGEGTTALATTSQRRQVFLALGTPADPATDILSGDLARIEERHFPGPLLNLGPGEALASAKAFDFETAPGMADYLAKADRIGAHSHAEGMAQLRSALAIPPGPPVILRDPALSNPLAIHARLDAAEQMVAKMAQRRRYSTDRDPQDKAPLLALCLSTEYPMQGLFTIAPMLHEHALVATMPGVQDWAKQRPQTPVQEAALLESTRAALGQALAELAATQGPASSFFDAPRMLGSLLLHVIDGRWVAYAIVDTRALNGPENMAEVRSFIGAAHGSLAAHLGGEALSIPAHPDTGPHAARIAEGIEHCIEQIHRGDTSRSPLGDARDGLRSLLTAADMRLAIPQAAPAEPALSRSL